MTNKLSPAQVELLACLAEEASEIIHIVTKTLRHGWDSAHPLTGRTNREAMQSELGDLVAIMQLLTDTQYHELSLDEIDDASKAKLKRLPKYLHHVVIPDDI